MPKKLEFLVIHCLDTPGKNFDKAFVERCHLMPRELPDRKMHYMGKTYDNVEALPNEYVGGVSIKKMRGRGWSVTGYADMINFDGDLINLNPYNFDDVIDNWEVTNGAFGYNGNSRHVVLCGGWHKDGRKGFPKDNLPLAEELYSEVELKKLREYIAMHKEIYPDIKIIGHNEISAKTCPNFDVPVFLKS